MIAEVAKVHALLLAAGMRVDADALRSLPTPSSGPGALSAYVGTLALVAEHAAMRGGDKHGVARDACHEAIGAVCYLAERGYFTPTSRVA